MNKPRLYSLFEKIDGRWVRQSTASYHKASAVRVFQSALLDGFFSSKTVALRVVKDGAL